MATRFPATPEELQSLQTQKIKPMTPEERARFRTTKEAWIDKGCMPESSLSPAEFNLSERVFQVIDEKSA